MRTNIDIDDELLAKAMQAGPYTTKKETVEAGLQLLARQAAYREILKWEGRLPWEGDESSDWTQSPAPTIEAVAQRVQESRASYRTAQSRAAAQQKRAVPTAGKKVTRRAGR